MSFTGTNAPVPHTAGPKSVALALALGIVAGLAALSFMLGRVIHRSGSGVGLPAPVFSLATPDGKNVSSADLRGRVIVLAFWATWCTPCRQELPALQKAYAHEKGRRTATFYAVDGPWGGDSLEKESAFASRMNMALPLAFDSHGAAQRALGVYALPALVILDSKGRVRLSHSGYAPSQRLGREIAAKLRALAR